MSGIGHNGGPAFPQFDVVAGDRDGHGDAIEAYTTATGGMSLRDYFAGQALMSLPHLCAHDTLLDGMTFEQHVARNAYRLADAMLAAREVGAS